MTAFRAALLDLDGTLLDSIPDLAWAANAMRVELGMAPLREDVVATFVGKGVDNRCAAAGRQPGGGRAGRRRLRPCPRDLPPPLPRGERREGHRLPAVIEGLKHLREQGLKLAVVTNKPTEFTLPLLQRAGWRAFSTPWSAATPAPGASPIRIRCCMPASCWAWPARGRDHRRLHQRRPGRAQCRHPGAGGALWLQRRS